MARKKRYIRPNLHVEPENDHLHWRSHEDPRQPGRFSPSLPPFERHPEIRPIGIRPYGPAINERNGPWPPPIEGRMPPFRDEHPFRGRMRPPHNRPLHHPRGHGMEYPLRGRGPPRNPAFDINGEMPNVRPQQNDHHQPHPMDHPKNLHSRPLNAGNIRGSLSINHMDNRPPLDSHGNHSPPHRTHSSVNLWQEINPKEQFIDLPPKHFPGSMHNFHDHKEFNRSSLFYGNSYNYNPNCFYFLCF